MVISQIIQLMPGSCWSPTGRPVANPVANQLSWPGTMKFGVVSAMCAALCASREVGGMSRMSLFRLWERESWNPWLSTILWRDLSLVNLGQSCHILLMCFFLKAEHFLQFNNQIPYPFSSFVWSPHISRYANKNPYLSPPLNTTHQVVIERLPPDLFDPPPRVDSQVLKLEPHQAINPSTLKWRLPWNWIYKLRNNISSLFLVSRKTLNNFKDMFFFGLFGYLGILIIGGWLKVLEVGGRERGIIDDLSFNIWAEEVRSIVFKHFQTCLLLELSCWEPKNAPPCQAAVEGVRASTELFLSLGSKLQWLPSRISHSHASV